MSQLQEHIRHKLAHPANAPGEAAGLDHPGHQPGLLHEADGVGVVAAEMKGRRQGRGDHLAVAANAARVIAVTQAFENIVDDYVQIIGPPMRWFPRLFLPCRTWDVLVLVRNTKLAFPCPAFYN